MIIRKLSHDFTPLSEGIFFGIESEGEMPTDIVVEIINVATGDVIATQLLRNTISAKVNIAPYLTHFCGYAPTKCGQTTFTKAPTASYKIRVDGIESEEVVISVNRTHIDTTPAIVTSLPLTRRIAYDEIDEVLVVADGGEKIFVEMENDNGETVHLEYLPTTKASLLVISPASFDTPTKSFNVALYCEGEKLGAIHYMVTPSLKGATRLAWLSESGAIERYTFPKSHKTTISTEKRRILTTAGVCATSCRTKQTISLVSRIEPCAMVEALAQIASAPKVWLEQDEECCLVDVVTSQIEYNIFGEASYLHLEVLISQKEVLL